MSQRRIRMRTRYANAVQAIEPGRVGEVDAAEAKALVDGGYAVYVTAEGLDEPPRRTTPGKPTSAAPPASDEVPDATIAVVMAWIDGDRDRAARALEVEQAKGDRARVKLVEDLTKLLDAEQE